MVYKITAEIRDEYREISASLRKRLGVSLDKLIEMALDCLSGKIEDVKPVRLEVLDLVKCRECGQTFRVRCPRCWSKEIALIERAKKDESSEEGSKRREGA